MFVFVFSFFEAVSSCIAKDGSGLTILLPKPLGLGLHAYSIAPSLLSLLGRLPHHPQSTLGDKGWSISLDSGQSRSDALIVTVVNSML